MRRAVVISGPLLDGKPNLGLTEAQREHIVKRGSVITVKWNDHTLVVRFVGTAGADAVFIGCGSEQILIALSHLGAGVQLLKTAWASNRTWLENHSVVATPAGRPIPPVVYAGDSPEGVGRDWEELAEGEPE